MTTSGHLPSHSQPPREAHVTGAFLHDGFELQATSRPDAVALVVKGERLTYGELGALAERLAQHLRSRGMGKGDRIGLCATRDVHLYVGLLGILKSGASYVPIDPEFPVERRDFIVRDSACRATVVSGVDTAGMTGDLVELGTDFDKVTSDATAEVPGPDSEAYVIYTSGTTGTPKGVPIRHSQAVNSITSMSDLYEVVPDDRVLQFASLSFDASLEQIFTAFSTGATLVARPDNWSLDSLLTLMEEEQVTIAEFTPTVWEALTRHLSETSGAPPAALSRVVLGGEAVDPATAARWFELSSIPLFNTYGPTEATITATAHRFDQAEDTMVIGVPVSGLRAHVMDATGVPVATGDRGELWLSGVGIADGYLDRPEQTAERFVIGPDGEHAYRTGDVVRLTDRGALEFLGRIDDQVKIGGVRIEPGEVSATLTEHPEVASAHVEIRSLQGHKSLVAHVVPNDYRQIPSVRHLQTFLAEKLPVALVPRYFTVLEELPVLPSGKLDRAALANIEVSPPQFDGDFVEPRSGKETRLATYWAEELGVERIGAEDDLVSLGAHSLRTMRIAARIARSESVDLSVGELLANPTVRSQAALIEQEQDRPRRFPLVVPSDEERTPMSEQQKQMWFLAHLNPDDASYRFQAVVRVSGALDLEVVDRVITELTHRHPVLRTTFYEDKDGFWQHPHPPQPVKAHRIDLRDIQEAQRQAASEAQLQAAIAEPLDLSKLPLQKWTVIQTADDQFELVLLESHMVHDGWAFALLMREFTALYNAFLVGEPSPLPTPELQYSDYVAWQKRELAPDGALTAQVNAWKDRFQDLPEPVSIPSDYSRTSATELKGGVVRIDVPGSLPDRIRAFCREHRVTLFDTMFAAYNVLLHRHTGQTDLCIGSAFANRRLPETSEILGMLVNTVLLRTLVDPENSFAELLSHVHRVKSDADDLQEVPFPEVVRALNPDRSVNSNPFTQVMFSAHDSDFPELNFGTAAGTVSYPSNGSAKFDLGVTILPAGESLAGQRDLADRRITIEWEYNSDMFAETTVQRMAARYLELLEQLIIEPTRPLSQFSLISDEERNELADLGRGGDLPKAPAANERVVDCIGEWASRTPDTVAIQDNAGQLTYRELDDCTDAVARALLHRGLGTEAVIGVFVERGRDLPIAAVATHKARMAYAPIDPEAPTERLIAMLDGIDVVLCSKSTAGRIPPDTAEVLVVEEAHRFGRDLTTKLPTNAESTDLAYVIYTSGSTGIPKGAMTQQGNLMALISWSDAELPLPQGKPVPFVLSQSFDASVWEMWRVLSAGATFLVVDDRIRKHPDELARWLRDNQITHCFMPTPMAIHVMRHHRDDLPDLTWLGAGGDRLEIPVGARLSFDVTNLYGTSETTVITVARTVPAGTLIGQDLAALPIGRPVAGHEVMVVDESGQPVPIGVPGELLIGGLGVGRGYFRAPSELTAERFGDRQGLNGRTGPYYRSGDVVRWNANGELEYLGRADRQVKVRGYRIEPGEVEAVMRAKTPVQDCAVVAQTKGSRTELVAFIVAPDGQSLQAGQLRAALKERLPDYMTPAVFVPVEEIPQTVNGKVDTAALPDSPNERLAHGAEIVRPRDEVERIIADMWADALGTDEIGVHDNFFDRGGHSLLATQLINQLEHRTGIRLNVREIYDSPTVAQLKTALLKRSEAVG